MYVLLTSKPGEYRSEGGAQLEARERYDYLFCGRLRARYTIAQVMQQPARVRIIDEATPGQVNEVPIKFLPRFDTLEQARAELQQLTRFGGLDARLVRSDEPPAPVKPADGQLRITFAKTEPRTVLAPINSNLLRVSLREKGGIPFKCGGGLCGTCKCRVTEGLAHTDAVKAKERKHLDEAQLAQGWRMACQTFVNGDVTVTW